MRMAPGSMAMSPLEREKMPRHAFPDTARFIVIFLLQLGDRLRLGRQDRVCGLELAPQRLEKTEFAPESGRVSKASTRKIMRQVAREWRRKRLKRLIPRLDWQFRRETRCGAR